MCLKLFSAVNLVWVVRKYKGRLCTNKLSLVFQSSTVDNKSFYLYQMIAREEGGQAVGQKPRLAEKNLMAPQSEIQTATG